MASAGRPTRLALGIKRVVRPVVSLCAVALWLQSSTGFAQASSQAIELPQADGTTLLLEQPAKTIITLSPHLAELAWAAGVGDRLIATVEYSNFPTGVEALPRVGDAFRLDLERIISLKPDLVLGWQSGNPTPALERLRELGVNTWIIEIRRPEDLAVMVAEIGKAGGRPAEGEKAAKRVQEQLQDIIESGRDKPSVSYFYQVAERPLFTLNGEHLVSQSLALCGGVNVFAHDSVLAPQISRESVIVSNPEVMFAPALPTEADPLAGWKEWPNIRAVRDGRLFLLPADEISRATPRMLEAVAAACSLLHGQAAQQQPHAIRSSRKAETT